MSYFARFAYVNRKDENSPVVEGFLEQKYIPACCSMNFNPEFEANSVRDGKYLKDRPDIFTMTYLKGSRNRDAELVFCVEKKARVESMYVEKQLPVISDETEWINKMNLICCNFPDDAEKDFYVFPKEILDDIHSSVGDMDVYMKTGNNLTVIKIHVFPENDELYRNMISELSELSTALIKGWDDDDVLVKAEGKDAVKNSTEDVSSNSALKRYINSPEDAGRFLSDFESRISVLQNHAETDLRQVYKKMPIRKAKHITPRTLIEYNSTKSPKVNVLTVEEHFDIYEHRMIKQYLLDFKESVRSKIRNSNKRIAEYGENQKEIVKNKNEVENSFHGLQIENREARIQEVRNKLTDSKEEFGKKIEKEKEVQKEWNGILKQLDTILEKYPILQVNLRSEKMHSSMLFLRNRYYRSVYELVQTLPLVHIYKCANAMPAQKLFTLYERWCYFKIVSIFMQKYDFKIYAFSTKQGKMHEENKRSEGLLEELIQSVISDVPYPTGDYINIVLKKTVNDSDPIRSFSENNNQYVKIEYQRKFGDEESKEKYGYLIPDFCITFGGIKEEKEEHSFDITGPIYILDSKFKKYNKFSMYHEIFYVAFFKYIFMIKEIEGVDIAGAYILHPNVGDEENKKDSGNIEVDYINDSKVYLRDTVKECYGRDAEALYNKYSSDGFVIEKKQFEDVNKTVDKRIIKTEDGKYNSNLEKLKAACEGREFIEKYPWKSFDRKFGSFGVIPGVDGYINRLFRMILEWDKPFGYSDNTHLLVWNSCLLCGSAISEEDIIEDSTVGGYSKYHITCPNCGEFWVKSHCWKCNIDLIKHTPGHNYLRGGSDWYVDCPSCGN